MLYTHIYKHLHQFSVYQYKQLPWLRAPSVITVDPISPLGEDSHSCCAWEAQKGDTKTYLFTIVSNKQSWNPPRELQCSLQVRWCPLMMSTLLPGSSHSCQGPGLGAELHSVWRCMMWSCSQLCIKCGLWSSSAKPTRPFSEYQAPSPPTLQSRLSETSPQSPTQCT